MESVADEASQGDLELSEIVPDEELLTDDALDEFEFDDAVPEIDSDDTVDGTPDAADVGDDLGWLSDMEAIQTGKLVIEPESEETAVPTEASVELDADEPELSQSVEAGDDSWGSGTLLDQSTVGEDLPDWLSQLDEKGQADETVEQDSASEGMPDWIASMRPSEGVIGSELPGVFAEMDLRDTLEGIPEELAGAELPVWLQDTPLDSAPLTPLIESDEDIQEIPDWLQPDTDEAEPAAPIPAATMDLPDTSSSRNEWNTLLEELPPLTPLAESLPKAEIPEWVQQLKPPELTGEPTREPEGPEEMAGPLKGMHGIVPIEPAIAKPRSALPLEPYVTTPEQQQQVALLRQITQETTETVATLSTKTAYATAVWLRLLLAVLLIAALLVGLRGPSLISTDVSVPAGAQAMNATVSAAAGQPVLIAFEYTPAMAAELSPQAELLLAQLAANNSPILITSQYAAGTAVANNLVGDTEAQIIGYLPGEGIGLRQLGDCLARRNGCEQLNGRLLADDIQTNLSQAELVIVLTGDRDNLVNWIEQVGSVATNVPVAAGVTQALTPLANNYAATEQLSGLLGGTPDTVAYEQLLDQSGSNLRSQLNAQIVGQLLAAAMLLIGLLAYGTTGVINRRS